MAGQVTRAAQAVRAQEACERAQWSARAYGTFPHGEFSEVPCQEATARRQTSSLAAVRRLGALYPDGARLAERYSRVAAAYCSWHLRELALG